MDLVLRFEGTHPSHIRESFNNTCAGSLQPYHKRIIGHIAEQAYPQLAKLQAVRVRERALKLHQKQTGIGCCGRKSLFANGLRLLGRLNQFISEVYLLGLELKQADLEQKDCDCREDEAPAKRLELHSLRLVDVSNDIKLSRSIRSTKAA